MKASSSTRIEKETKPIRQGRVTGTAPSLTLTRSLGEEGRGAIREVQARGRRVQARRPTGRRMTRDGRSPTRRVAADEIVGPCPAAHPGLPFRIRLASSATGAPAGHERPDAGCL